MILYQLDSQQKIKITIYGLGNGKIYEKLSIRLGQILNMIYMRVCIKICIMYMVMRNDKRMLVFWKKVTTCVRRCEKKVKMKDSYCCFPFRWFIFCTSESRTLCECMGESKWILFSYNLQWNQSHMNRPCSMCASLVLLHVKTFKKIMTCPFLCMRNRKRLFFTNGICISFNG